ncbi:MAG: hypothetical protein ACK5JS_10035, partial [Mangrovibacterium sp.]
SGEVLVELGSLKPEEIGIEVIVKSKDDKISKMLDFEAIGTENGITTYRIDISLNDPGVFNYGIRLFAKHPELPHRQDFQYIRWI